MAILNTPFKSSGTTLGYKLTSGGATYTLVGELQKFDFGGTDVGVIDTTTLASTAKTKIPSIPDNGDLSFSVFLVPGDATSVQLQTWSQSPAVSYWEVMLPDGSSGTTGTTITFAAFLSNYSPKGFEVDGSPMADITLTLTGGVTLTAGT